MASVDQLLWGKDPEHPEVPYVSTLLVIWNHWQAQIFDVILKSLTGKHSKLSEAIKPNGGYALSRAVAERLEPAGLGAAEAIENEIKRHVYVEGTCIHDHLTELQSMILKYDQVSHLCGGRLTVLRWS